MMEYEYFIIFSWNLEPSFSSKHLDFIIHYIASFYLHIFPTWLIYENVNSLVFSVKCIPNNSPSSPNDQRLVKVFSGTHPMWWSTRDNHPCMYATPASRPVCILLILCFKQWYWKPLKEIKITSRVKESMLQNLCNCTAVLSTVSCSRRKAFYFKRKPVLLILMPCQAT